MIRIFVTGGTFDKTYDEISGRLAFDQTHLPEMLQLGRSRVDIAVETLMMIDSLDMTDADRPRIVESCAAMSGVAHRHHPRHRHDGRDRAGGRPKRPDKTVVLTGAMVPYAFGSSDGLFNLGSALSFAEVLPPGVYIAMNGEHLPWDQVRKNRESGVFERVA